VSPDDPALIQYTSGSTGDPKGVLLSNANVLANIRAIAKAIAVRPDDVGVSWLPLYHDMELIGSWLAALHFAIPIVILSPMAFLRRPSRWLRAIHAHRGTLSAAPNFQVTLRRGTGYQRSQRRQRRPLIRPTRTLRIRQIYGLDRSSKRSTLPLPAAAIVAQCDFHDVSRATGPP
jgi:acyl-coenzyme A synthetase/AMP-(fatty) acid ligase